MFRHQHTRLRPSEFQLSPTSKLKQFSQICITCRSSECVTWRVEHTHISMCAHTGQFYPALYIASRHHINISSQSKRAQAWLLKQNPISLWNVIKAVWLQDMFGCSETLGLHLLGFRIEAQPRDSTGYFDEWCETKYKGDKRNDHEKQNTTGDVTLFMRCFTSHRDGITLWQRFPWKIKHNRSFLWAFELEMRKQHVFFTEPL